MIVGRAFGKSKTEKRKQQSVANNPIPGSYPSLVVQLNEAYEGAENIGADIPLLIGTDRTALMTAQTDFRATRGAIPALSTTRKEAVNAAYDFC